MHAQYMTIVTRSGLFTLYVHVQCRSTTVSQCVAVDLQIQVFTTLALKASWHLHVGRAA